MASVLERNWVLNDINKLCLGGGFFPTSGLQPSPPLHQWLPLINRSDPLVLLVWRLSCAAFDLLLRFVCFLLIKSSFYIFLEVFLGGIQVSLKLIQRLYLLIFVRMSEQKSWAAAVWVYMVTAPSNGLPEYLNENSELLCCFLISDVHTFWEFDLKKILLNIKFKNHYWFGNFLIYR